jgi:hypothetical protein
MPLFDEALGHRNGDDRKHSRTAGNMGQLQSVSCGMTAGWKNGRQGPRGEGQGENYDSRLGYR